MGSNSTLVVLNTTVTINKVYLFNSKQLTIVLIMLLYKKSPWRKFLISKFEIYTH